MSPTLRDPREEGQGDRPADRASQTQDRRFMLRALHLAAQGRGYVGPNPMVGAVIVREGHIIGEGHHGRFGGPHAEAQALQDARSRGEDPRGATLYVNLEPCAHWGKTPPCARAVAQAGIRRVVAATRDPTWSDYSPSSESAGEATAAMPSPNGRSRPTGAGWAVADFERRGFDILRRVGVSTQLGPCREEAAVLNAAFFKRSRSGLPLVTAKWAMSADGKIATRLGASRWISCAESRRIVHELRGMVDAIVVGRRTVERDDPLLICREAEARRTAARVVLCGSSGLPGPDSNLARTAEAAPVILAHPEGAPAEGSEALRSRGCELLPLPAARQGGVDLRSLLEELSRRGAGEVLVEGGREVLGSFFDEGLVDRVMVFVAPFVIGGTEAVTAVGGGGVATIKAAIPLLGRKVAGGSSHGAPGHAPHPACQTGDAHTDPSVGEDMPPQVETTVRLVGSDVLLEGWTADPLQWAPAEDWHARAGPAEGNDGG